MDRERLSRFLNRPLHDVPLEAPVFVDPAISVREAVSRMQASRASCALVMNGADIAGIFTERDVLTRCMAPDFDWDQPIGTSVATQSPQTIGASHTVAEAIATFQRYGYRTLPVVDDGQVAGLIRVGDVLMHIAEAFPEEVLNLPPRPHQVMERPEGG